MADQQSLRQILTSLQQTPEYLQMTFAFKKGQNQQIPLQRTNNAGYNPPIKLFSLYSERTPSIFTAAPPKSKFEKNGMKYSGIYFSKTHSVQFN